MIFLGRGACFAVVIKYLGNYLTICLILSCAKEAIYKQFTTAKHAVKIEPFKYLGKHLPICPILSCAKESIYM